MSENFDKKYFLELLSTVGNNLNSIKTVSNYMYYHRENHHELSISLWKEYFFSLSDHTNSFVLFFIINEVLLLSCKKRKLELVASFGDCLSDIIVNLTLKCEDINCLLKVYEIIQIWESLMIYSSNFTKELENMIIEKVSHIILYLINNFL
jgi:hypothetical protein